MIRESMEGQILKKMAEELLKSAQNYSTRYRFSHIAATAFGCAMTMSYENAIVQQKEINRME
jgi:hypothetical protein